MIPLVGGARSRRRGGEGLRDLRQCRYALALRDLRRSAPRRSGMLIVVEDVADLWALERAGVGPVRYHVLGGVLSPLDGVGPDDLSIDALIGARPSSCEIVLAVNATVEGQTTAHYITDRLRGQRRQDHPPGPWRAGGRRTRLSRRGHAEPGAQGPHELLGTPVSRSHSSLTSTSSSSSPVIRSMASSSSGRECVEMVGGVIGGRRIEGWLRHRRERGCRWRRRSGRSALSCHHRNRRHADLRTARARREAGRRVPRRDGNSS